MVVLCVTRTVLGMEGRKSLLFPILGLLQKMVLFGTLLPALTIRLDAMIYLVLF